MLDPLQIVRLDAQFCLTCNSRIDITSIWKYWAFAAFDLEETSLSSKRTGDDFIVKFDFVPFYNGTVTNRLN